MKCDRCGVESTAIHLASVWYCVDCANKVTHVKEELAALYKDGPSDIVRRYVYISSTTANLDAVKEWFTTQVELDAPNCQIVLVSPYGVGRLNAPFDIAYVDDDALTDEMKHYVPLTPEGYVKTVNHKTGIVS